MSGESPVYNFDPETVLHYVRWAPGNWSGHPVAVLVPVVRSEHGFVVVERDGTVTSKSFGTVRLVGDQVYPSWKEAIRQAGG